MINEIPPHKLAWFGVSSVFGGCSAVMGYCSRSGDRTFGAGTIAAGNGLLVGLLASLMASSYADCDPIWLVVGAIGLGWSTGFAGVIQALAWAWAAKENALAFVDAIQEVRQAAKARLTGSRPTPPLPQPPKPDDESTGKSPPGSSPPKS